jgi:peptidyl-prolyl cis-trans isomerase D
LRQQTRPGVSGSNRISIHGGQQVLGHCDIHAYRSTRRIGTDQDTSGFDDIGVDNDPVEATGGYVWYSVAGITAARDRELKEVKAEVEQSWRGDQVAERLKAKAAALLEKLKNGTPVDALAKTELVKVESAADIKRGVASPGLSPKEIEAVFHTDKDKFGSSQGQTPSQWIVFRVTGIKTPGLDPKSAESKRLEQLLERQVGDDVFNQYVAWLESFLGTTINQAMLAQAVGNSAQGIN